MHMVTDMAVAVCRLSHLATRHYPSLLGGGNKTYEDECTVRTIQNHLRNCISVKGCVATELHKMA